jgi:hypothetical protein
MAAGLLATEQSPSLHFPVHFSSLKTLDWLHGAYLGEEFIIDQLL